MRVSASPFSDERQLEAIDQLIEERPDELRLRFARACCLEDLGRPDDALRGYLEILQREPTHFASLTNLGSLLFERGDLENARPYFVAAAALHPGDPVAHVNLGLVYTETGAFDQARANFQLVLMTRPDHFHALHGLAMVSERQGDRAGAEQYLTRAFATPRMSTLPYTGGAQPLDVLSLASGRGGSVVSNLFFDDRVVRRTVLIPESFPDDRELPPHHVLFNGIGDADRAASSLERARALVARSAAPVINDPAAVLATGRTEVMRRLRDVPGVVAPRTERVARAGLTAERLSALGFGFPLLLRAPGFHTGDHFERVERPDDLAVVLATLPGEELFAIEALDARGADGGHRKYRVVFVDRRAYPVHLAIAADWKVHYFSADMAGHADHRAEEARFLADMEAVLPPRALRALAEVAELLALDYAGIDFGLSANGDVLAFEANATMAVYPPDADPRFAYRREPVERAIAAARSLVLERGRAGGWAGDRISAAPKPEPGC